MIIASLLKIPNSFLWTFSINGVVSCYVIELINFRCTNACFCMIMYVVD